jgi:sigma-B regulation protein RsbU (phosphoserine phosphatase)
VINTLKDLMQGLLGGEAAPGESREMFLLAELSQAFAQSLDIEETLRSAADHIIDFLDAEAASVFLVEGDELVCRASSGPSPITGLRLPLGAGIVGKTLAEGGWKMVRDVRQDPDFYGAVDSKTHFTTRSIMCTVLQAGERKFGVLEVLNKKSGNGLFSEQDLQVLRVLGTAVSLAVRNAQMASDLVAQKRLRRELELARELQQQLLPAPRQEPFPLEGINLPAHEVSGDFYDYFEVEGGRIGFTIGDVSGKGLNAALLMVRTTSLLRCLGRAGLPLPRLLSRVNAELCETGARGMFVCVFAGLYDPRNGRLTWANAGFPPGLHRAPSGRYQQLKADSPPLGIAPDTEFHEHQLHLGGGALYLYTDGVTEAHGPDGRALDEDGLRKLIEAHAGHEPGQRLPALVQSLRDLSRKDDTTLLLLEDRRQGSERLMDLHLPAAPESLRRVREAAAQSLRAVGLGPEAVERLVLALDEACANVIRHGYRGAKDGLMDLALERRGQSLVFLLRDYAEACNPAQLRPRRPSRKRSGGLGLHFIDTIMDHWEHRKPADGRGNLLVMRKKIG